MLSRSKPRPSNHGGLSVELVRIVPFVIPAHPDLTPRNFKNNRGQGRNSRGNSVTAFTNENPALCFARSGHVP